MPAAPLAPPRKSAVSFPATTPTLGRAADPHRSASEAVSRSSRPITVTPRQRSAAYRSRLPLTAVCLVGGGVAALQSPPWLDPASPAGLTLAGLGLLAIAAGAALRMWAISSIGEHKMSRIVVTGAYSLCRNPLYIGTLLIVLGFLALWQNTVLALLAVAPMLLYPLGVVPSEERTLARVHPVEYEAYRRRTPRWIPRFSSYVPDAAPTFRSAGARKEWQANLWWFGLAGLSLWISVWRWAGV